MSTRFAIDSNGLTDLLYEAGFLFHQAGGKHMTLRHPTRKMVVTIPCQQCRLGGTLVMRALCEAGLVNSDLTFAGSDSGRPPADTGASFRSLTPIEMLEREKIAEVLRSTAGNKLETSRLLGIGRQTLYNKIKTYRIEV